MVPQRPSETEETQMSLQLWEVDCGDACGFRMWSHDETELVYFFVSHAKNVHNAPFSLAEARKRVRHAYDAKRSPA